MLCLKLGQFKKGMNDVSEQLVDYASLSDEAKKHARNNFVTFYVRQFKSDNLEVVSSQADDPDLAMINHLIGENNFQTVDQLVPLCEQMVQGSFDRVLTKLSMKYNQNGETEKSWATWGREIHAQLPVED